MAQTRDEDGLILYVYYVFMQEFILELAASDLEPVAQVEGVDPGSRTNESEEAAKLRPR